jgi:outer membrane protein assembly factor BamB
MSPPKKTGTWWMRYEQRGGLFLTFLFLALALFYFATSCQKRLTGHAKPDKVTFTKNVWYANSTGPKLTENRSNDFISLALSDVNGDKNTDVVLRNTSGHLLTIDGITKTPLWQGNVRFNTTKSIVLSDLNENGLHDVVAVGQDSRLRAFDGGSGGEIWVSPILGESVSTPPLIWDLNGDRIKDAVICTKSGQIHVGYGDFFQIHWKTIETGIAINSVPSTADLDGDGIWEVFIGTADGKIFIVNGYEGTLSKVFDFVQRLGKTDGASKVEHHITAPTGLLDINGNDKLDLVAGSEQGHFIAVDGSTMKLIWRAVLPTRAGEKIFSKAPVFCHLNDDDINDVLLISDSSIKAVAGTTEILKQPSVLWEYFSSDGESIKTPVSLADLNKDDFQDIIIGTTNGAIVIIDGHNGALMTRIEDRDVEILSTLVVADLGKDGYIDILYAGSDHKLYTIQTNSPVMPGTVLWGQMYGNERNTGHAEVKSVSYWGNDLMVLLFACLSFGFGYFTYTSRSKRRQEIVSNLGASLAADINIEPDKTGNPHQQ